MVSTRKRTNNLNRKSKQKKSTPLSVPQDVPLKSSSKRVTRYPQKNTLRNYISASSSLTEKSLNNTARPKPTKFAKPKSKIPKNTHPEAKGVTNRNQSPPISVKEMCIKMTLDEFHYNTNIMELIKEYFMKKNYSNNRIKAALSKMDVYVTRVYSKYIRKPEYRDDELFTNLKVLPEPLEICDAKTKTSSTSIKRKKENVRKGSVKNVTSESSDSDDEENNDSRKSRRQSSRLQLKDNNTPRCPSPKEGCSKWLYPSITTRKQDAPLVLPPEEVLKICSKMSLNDFYHKTNIVDLLGNYFQQKNYPENELQKKFRKMYLHVERLYEHFLEKPSFRKHEFFSNLKILSMPLADQISENTSVRTESSCSTVTTVIFKNADPKRSPSSKENHQQCREEKTETNSRGNEYKPCVENSKRKLTIYERPCPMSKKIKFRAEFQKIPGLDHHFNDRSCSASSTLNNSSSMLPNKIAETNYGTIHMKSSLIPKKVYNRPCPMSKKVQLEEHEIQTPGPSSHDANRVKRVTVAMSDAETKTSITSTKRNKEYERKSSIENMSGQSSDSNDEENNGNRKTLGQSSRLQLTDNNTPRCPSPKEGCSKWLYPSVPTRKQHETLVLPPEEVLQICSKMSLNDFYHKTNIVDLLGNYFQQKNYPENDLQKKFRKMYLHVGRLHEHFLEKPSFLKHEFFTNLKILSMPLADQISENTSVLTDSSHSTVSTVVFKTADRKTSAESKENHQQFCEEKTDTNSCRNEYKPHVENSKRKLTIYERPSPLSKKIKFPAELVKSPGLDYRSSDKSCLAPSISPNKIAETSHGTTHMKSSFISKKVPDKPCPLSRKIHEAQTEKHKNYTPIQSSHNANALKRVTDERTPPLLTKQRCAAEINDSNDVNESHSTSLAGQCHPQFCSKSKNEGTSNKISTAISSQNEKLQPLNARRNESLNQNATATSQIKFKQNLQLSDVEKSEESRKIKKCMVKSSNDVDHVSDIKIQNSSVMNSNNSTQKSIDNNSNQLIHIKRTKLSVSPCTNRTNSYVLGQQSKVSRLVKNTVRSYCDMIRQQPFTLQSKYGIKASVEEYVPEHISSDIPKYKPSRINQKGTQPIMMEEYRPEFPHHKPELCNTFNYTKEICRLTMKLKDEANMPNKIFPPSSSASATDYEYEPITDANKCVNSNCTSNDTTNIVIEDSPISTLDTTDQTKDTQDHTSSHNPQEYENSIVIKEEDIMIDYTQDTGSDVLYIPIEPENTIIIDDDPTCTQQMFQAMMHLPVNDELDETPRISTDHINSKDSDKTSLSTPLVTTKPIMLPYHESVDRDYLIEDASSPESSPQKQISKINETNPVAPTNSQLLSQDLTYIRDVMIIAQNTVAKNSLDVIESSVNELLHLTPLKERQVINKFKQPHVPTIPPLRKTMELKKYTCLTYVDIRSVHFAREINRMCYDSKLPFLESQQAKQVKAIVKVDFGCFHSLHIDGDALKILLNLTSTEWKCVMKLFNVIETFEYKSSDTEPTFKSLPYRILFYLFKTLPRFSQAILQCKPSHADNEVSCIEMKVEYCRPVMSLTKAFKPIVLSNMKALKANVMNV